jgi:RHS repeat-associated protein
VDGGSPPNVTANLLTGRGSDQYFTRTDSAGARNFLADMRGSTIALADSSGTLQTQYNYDPFGNATLSGASSANPYQFTGRENDSTGLYYYRARYYSPTFQRFVAQDPIGFAGRDTNLYDYSREQPTDLSDPSGEGGAFPPSTPGPMCKSPPNQCPGGSYSACLTEGFYAIGLGEEPAILGSAYTGELAPACIAYVEAIFAPAVATLVLGCYQACH